LLNYIENLGKRPLEQSGKHRVNENDEEIFRHVDLIPALLRGSGHRAILVVLENDGAISRHCERSEAIHSREGGMDCFVAALLAMTAGPSSWPGLSRPSTSSLIRTSQDVDARDKPGHDVS
jgi:hypothetical protein